MAFELFAHRVLAGLARRFDPIVTDARQRNEDGVFR